MVQHLSWEIVGNIMKCLNELHKWDYHDNNLILIRVANNCSDYDHHRAAVRIQSYARRYSVKEYFRCFRGNSFFPFLEMFLERGMRCPVRSGRIERDRRLSQQQRTISAIIHLGYPRP
jgi:hypothetical protein